MAQAKTVLIVDDDPDIVESTKITLESAGYAVLTAGGGAEALQQLQKKVPNLILLDVMMTKLTEGFEFTYKLRQDPALSKIPVIIVSAIGPKFGMNFAEEKGSDFLPTDDYLDKPVKPKVLLEKIAAVLKKRG